MLQSVLMHAFCPGKTFLYSSAAAPQCSRRSCSGTWLECHRRRHHCRKDFCISPMPAPPPLANQFAAIGTGAFAAAAKSSLGPPGQELHLLLRLPNLLKIDIIVSLSRSQLGFPAAAAAATAAACLCELDASSVTVVECVGESIENTAIRETWGPPESKV